MIKQYGNIIIIAMAALVIMAHGKAYAANIKWGGEFETEIYANDKSDEPEIGSINSFTLINDTEINPRTSFHARLIFRHSTGYRIIDDNEISQALIDRVHLNLYLNKIDLIIGKQRLAWGSGYAFNPTDVFNPPDITDPKGERTGVSALRINLPLGEVSELMLVGVQKEERLNLEAEPGNEADTSRKAQDAEFALRGKTSLDKFSFTLLVIDLGEDEAEKIGGSVSGEFLDLGIWTEGALTFPEDDLRNKYDEKNYWQVVAGLDYTFLNGLYVLGEFYKNGRGHWSKKDYQWNRLRRVEINNLAEDYFFTMVSKNVTDLVEVNFANLLNINDQSFFYHPRVKYNVYEDTMISCGMHGFCGVEESEFYGEKNSPNYRVPNEFYLNFLVNF